MKEGVLCGAGDFLSTATWQPIDYDRAKALYNQTHKGDNAVVVVKIPCDKINNPGTDKHLLATVKGIGYFHPKKQEFAIRPEYVSGWIDRDNETYNSNPYENRMPVKGFEQFEDMLD